MAKYLYELDLGNGRIIESEEVFSSYSEAEEAARNALSDFAAGAEILELMGRDFDDPDNASYSIIIEG